jgi:hypothetical protein
MTDLHEQMRVIKDLETRLEGERELATVRRQQREGKIETERDRWSPGGLTRASVTSAQKSGRMPCLRRYASLLLCSSI